MGIPLLILKIEGPLQAWGMKSQWEIRDTGREPSKSGIMGMIACALGYRKDEVQKIKELHQKVKMGVREDKPGSVMRDYHTISGAFPKAGGGAHPTDHTIISKRFYIEDASFLIVLSSSKDVLKKIQNAITHPKWPIYLGRKSCIPTRPIFEEYSETYDSIEDVLKNYRLDQLHIDFYRTQGKKTVNVRILIEDLKGDLLRQDEFKGGAIRLFGYRRVNEKTIAIPITGGSE